RSPRHRRTPAEDVFERVGFAARPRRLDSDQLEIERHSNSACNLVLDSEQVADLAIEPLRPQMRPGFCVDQLIVDAELAAGPPNTPFKHKADTEPTADLPRVDRPAAIGEGGV